MAEEKKCLKQQIEEFDAGKYNSPDLNIQCEAGWYDWFCKDTSLAGKTKHLYRLVKKFVKVANIDLEKYYVFFKNNCPMWAGLYDDFRICDIETGDVVYNFAPRYPVSKTEFTAQVYYNKAGWDNPVVSGSIKECMDFFFVQNGGIVKEKKIRIPKQNNFNLKNILENNLVIVKKFKDHNYTLTPEECERLVQFFLEVCSKNIPQLLESAKRMASIFLQLRASNEVHIFNKIKISKFFREVKKINEGK
jgi:hypothetical protein